MDLGLLTTDKRYVTVDYTERKQRVIRNQRE